MGLHANMDTGDGIHIPYAWTYADQSAREGASGFTGSDVGKFARQLDDNTIWMLVATTPTWMAIGGGESSTPTLLVFTCRKKTAGTISQGSPVYLAGWNAGGWAEVEAAKADAAATMPAIGIARTDITEAADAEAVAFGVAVNVNTDGLTVGDALYVSAATAGALTATRPTGATDLIQIVAKVLKVHASEGQVLVAGAGRVNAMPNLTQGKYWIGDSNNHPSEAVPFGAQFQDAASEGESETSSTSWVQKLRLTTPSIPAGRYRVGWHYEWNYASAANDALVQVQVDDDAAKILMEMTQEPPDAGSDQWNNKGGFGYVDLAAGAHTVDLDYRAGNGLYSITIRKARLELWRVS